MANSARADNSGSKNQGFNVTNSFREAAKFPIGLPGDGELRSYQTQAASQREVVMTDKPEVKRSRDDIWMPFYVGDYLADTNRLTTEQHGAYLLLILDYWKSGPIPDDDDVLARITRLSSASWTNSRSVLVAFFKHADGYLTHKRIDKEREKAISLADKHHDRAQKAATARWEAERARAASGSADATSNATSNSQAMLDECSEQCLSDAIYSNSHNHSHSHSHLKSTTPSQGEDSKPLGVVNPETGEILNSEAGWK
jgi:uncharacterized protein YdaU (DUF1376 family)